MKRMLGQLELRIEEMDGILSQKQIKHMGTDESIEYKGHKSIEMLFKKSDLEGKRKVISTLLSSKYIDITEDIVINCINEVYLTDMRQLELLFEGNEQLLTKHIINKVNIETYKEQKIRFRKLFFLSTLTAIFNGVLLTLSITNSLYINFLIPLYATLIFLITFFSVLFMCLSLAKYLAIREILVGDVNNRTP